MRLFRANEEPQGFAGFRDPEARARLRALANGAGGVCPRHGVYDGYRCPHEGSHKPEIQKDGAT